MNLSDFMVDRMNKKRGLARFESGKFSEWTACPLPNCEKFWEFSEGQLVPSHGASKRVINSTLRLSTTHFDLVLKDLRFGEINQLFKVSCVPIQRIARHQAHYLSAVNTHS